MSISPSRQRWCVVYDRDGPSIEPVENSCRDYDCCGGTKCGWDTKGVMEEIRGYYKGRYEFFQNMSMETFIRYFGYDPDEQQEMDFDDAEVCTCADCRHHAHLR